MQKSFKNNKGSWNLFSPMKMLFIKSSLEFQTSPWRHIIKAIIFFLNQIIFKIKNYDVNNNQNGMQGLVKISIWVIFRGL